ncbi:unnamed protein product [Urochloa decumbens]|uniref:F-box domain-containing protein n=1 Tax=Urochloa decumbens TaxID=240449 RepID=A0ABC9GXS1_9POAL
MPPGAGIDVLPDEVLHQILGLVEAHESVRTCAVARRWRHLWKSATGLRIIAGAGKFLGSVEKFCNFMDILLRQRPGPPLHTCELTLAYFDQWISKQRYDPLVPTMVNAWFWHAVRCQVRVLRLRACSNDHLIIVPTFVTIDKRPVDSRHLTMLELGGIVVNRRLLDFSNCPLLERLEFKSCDFDPDGDSRLRICAPSLVSLILDDIWGMAPMLESMPSLVKAIVATENSMEDCDEVECNCEFCRNSYSIGDDTGSNGSVLLKGLSEVKDLTLISVPEQYIFKKDLRWCPIFSKLKTLLLNEYWCVPDDFRALVCILEHSPVLEKLTLELSSKKYRQQRERKGTLRPMEGSAAILEHLKIIEVRCDAVDERICKLTLFLCAFPIRLTLN